MSRVRVSICDDSRTYTFALKRFLEADGDLEVVGTHGDAETLIRALPRERPDLVTMDLELPGMDGVQATERILAGPHPAPVVVLSAHVSPGSERAAAALAGGAVEAILKSALPLTDVNGAAAAATRRRFRRLARAKVAPLPLRPARPAPAPAAPRRPAARRAGSPVAAIGIGASTGGPQALAAVLAALPAAFPIPVLVVQHMSAGFTAGLATWLDRITKLPVRLGEPGTPATRGVWFAPEGGHMTVDDRLVLRRGPTGRFTRHVPAADALLVSMAESWGPAAAGVVLTGLGRDGAQGVSAILAAGGRAYAQDEASSVVDGMPGAAAAAGARVVELSEVAAVLSRLTPAAAP